MCNTSWMGGAYLFLTNTRFTRQKTSKNSLLVTKFHKIILTVAILFSILNRHFPTESTITKHRQECFETHNVSGTVPTSRKSAEENWLSGRGLPGLHTRNLNVVIANVNKWRPDEVMEMLNFLVSNRFIQEDDVSNIDAISYFLYFFPISSNPLFFINSLFVGYPYYHMTLSIRSPSDLQCFSHSQLSHTGRTNLVAQLLCWKSTTRTNITIKPMGQRSIWLCFSFARQRFHLNIAIRLSDI